MEKFFESMIGKFLRWLAIIPVAFLALILIPIVINFFISYLWGIGETFLSSFIKSIIVSGLGSSAFVYFGSIIAPLYKRAVSIILCVILVSLYITLFLGIIKYDLLWTDGITEGWHVIVSFLALIGGSIHGLVLVRGEN